MRLAFGGAEVGDCWKNMISYAQNFEDVILARVFGAGHPGFYIDAGAGDPTEESVTRHFYDLGWTGINIEPEPLYYERLAAERPRDVNLCIALGEVEETRCFHHTSVRGISTLSRFFREQFEQKCSCVYEEREINVTTLAQICKQYVASPIDFLKIDVEGWEGEVLRGGDWNTYRPIVVLLEATEPTPYVPAWDWEPTILGFGYDFVYYDGLNRFYLRTDRQDLKHHFQHPPNVHDLFITHSRAQVDGEVGRLLTSLDGERARSEQLAIQLSAQRGEADELRARCQASAAESSALQLREADLNEKIRLLNEAAVRLTWERDNHWARAEQIIRDQVSYREGAEKLLKGIDQERERFDQAAKDWQGLRQETDRLIKRLTLDREAERRQTALQLRDKERERRQLAQAFERSKSEHEKERQRSTALGESMVRECELFAEATGKLIREKEELRLAASVQLEDKERERQEMVRMLDEFKLLHEQERQRAALLLEDETRECQLLLEEVGKRTRDREEDGRLNAIEAANKERERLELATRLEALAMEADETLVKFTHESVEKQQAMRQLAEAQARIEGLASDFERERQLSAAALDRLAQEREAAQRQAEQAMESCIAYQARLEQAHLQSAGESAKVAALESDISMLRKALSDLKREVKDQGGDEPRGNLDHLSEAGDGSFLRLACAASEGNGGHP